MKGLAVNHNTCSRKKHTCDHQDGLLTSCASAVTVSLSQCVRLSGGGGIYSGVMVLIQPRRGSPLHGPTLALSEAKKCAALSNLAADRFTAFTQIKRERERV